MNIVSDIYSIVFYLIYMFTLFKGLATRRVVNDIYKDWNKLQYFDQFFEVLLYKLKLYAVNFYFHIERLHRRIKVVHYEHPEIKHILSQCRLQ